MLDDLLNQFLKSLISWGPGAVLSYVIIQAIYRLADKFATQAIAAQQAQAVAMAAQAKSMEGLQQSMTEFVSRDNSEHREMLVLLKYIAQDKPDLDRVRTEHDNCRGCAVQTEK